MSWIKVYWNQNTFSWMCLILFLVLLLNHVNGNKSSFNPKRSLSVFFLIQKSSIWIQVSFICDFKMSWTSTVQTVQWKMNEDCFNKTPTCCFKKMIQNEKCSDVHVYLLLFMFQYLLQTGNMTDWFLKSWNTSPDT